MIHIEQFSSPNFNERQDLSRPWLIILHYTATTAEAAHAIYMDPAPAHDAGPVSPHFMIDETGGIAGYVPPDKRAWHAGKACWQGVGDINSASIGIELVNPGHGSFYRDFTAAQLDALQRLLVRLIGDYGIKAHHILGHSDVAPGRKTDPGEKFPWQWQAGQGFGLWPETQAPDYITADEMAADFDREMQAFARFGYCTQFAGIADIRCAFCMHYLPEAVENGIVQPGWTREMLARLSALNRMRGA